MSGWAAFGSAALSFLGGRQAQLASADQAFKQQRFQEYMSNTAHQREVADLRAAGLNPVLSATGGHGASTPPGAMARMEDIGTPAVSSALQAKLAQAQLENMQEQNKLLIEQRRREHESIYETYWRASAHELESKILEERLKGERIEGAFDSSAFGYLTRGANRIIEPLVSGSSALRNLRRPSENFPRPGGQGLRVPRHRP